MTFSSGELVVLAFPFTDLINTKRRPAVVLSSPGYTKAYGDIIAVPLTTKQQKDPYCLLQDWQQVNLPRATWVKPHIATIHASHVTRVLGVLTYRDHFAVWSIARQLLHEPIEEMG